MAPRVWTRAGDTQTGGFWKSCETLSLQPLFLVCSEGASEPLRGGSGLQTLRVQAQGATGVHPALQDLALEVTWSLWTTPVRQRGAGPPPKGWGEVLEELVGQEMPPPFLETTLSHSRFVRVDANI